MVTGGKCERLPAVTPDDTWEEFKVALTAAACKASGGLWRGGHDVSGHVFMLVLGSAFLALEALGTSPSNTPETSQVHDKDDLDGVHTASSDPITKFSTKFVWIVVGLSWWMLFIYLYSLLIQLS